jgi:hypothetical protein
LGPYPELGLGEARKKHAELRARVLNGIDPFTEKHSAKGVIAKAGAVVDAERPRLLALGEIEQEIGQPGVAVLRHSRATA